MVFVDTFHRNLGNGDENSAKDIAKFLQNIDLYLRSIGVAVIPVHHSGNESNGRSRGSSSIRAAMDVEYEVKKDADTETITVTNTKMKNFEQPKSFSFKFKPVAESVVLEPTDYVKSTAKKSLSNNALIALRCLDSIIEREGIESPQIIREQFKDSPQNIPAKVATIEQWRVSAYESIPVVSDNPKDALKKAFQRCRTDLETGQHWIDAANDKKTIVFASSVEHSKNIVAEFIEGGISAKHLDANTPANERDQTLQEWRDGQFTVLSNMGLFVEGLDVPAAACCVLARPTKSLTIYLQAVGRVMRPHESKTDCVILDCAGLTYEHGFVDDAREWTLNGKIKKPRDEESSVYVCSECAFAYSKSQHPYECPECGFKTPVEHKEIEHADVDMVELTPSIVADLRAKRAKFLEQTKCKTLDDFIELGKLRGYKIGWAYLKWNERKAWLESNGYPVPNNTI